MTETGQRVVVVDLRIPFVRLVLFFVKAAFAAIPAAIIVGFLLMLVTALFAGLDRPCIVRWKLFTLPNNHILRRAGTLSAPDRRGVASATGSVLC